MKILIEEIVRSHPAKSPATYRRERGIVYELPDMLLGHVKPGNRLRDVGDKRDLRILRARAALLDSLVDVSAYVGLVVDVCNEETFGEIGTAIDVRPGSPEADGARYDAWLKQHEVPS